MKNSFLFLLLLLLTILVISIGVRQSFAQNTAVDSLETILKIAKEDTSKVNTLNILIKNLINLGEQKKAFEFGTIAQGLAQKLHFKMGEGIALNNIAILHYNEGNFPKALEFNLKALKIREAIEDKAGIGASLNNLGLIYYHLSNYEKALDYHLKALKTREEISDQRGIAGSLSNLGIIYEALEDYSKALDYYRQSLKIKEAIGDRRGIANSLQGIGMSYTALGKFDEAVENHIKALAIRQELEDKLGEAYSFINIGITYFEQKDYKKALPYFKNAQTLADETGDISLISEVHLKISETYRVLGTHDKALEHYKRHITVRDSLFNEENTKKIVESEMNFEFEKKEAIAKAEQEKKNALALEELEKQRMQRNGFIGGFALMLALSGVSYHSYRNKQKANMLLSEQKQIIEEKNKNITDSITYAKQIQQAILPFEERFKHAFGSNYFIHFKPRDIVSGDFYWFTEKELPSPSGEGPGVKLTFLAVVDCTGHGVPGAFMSMVGSAALSNIVNEKGITVAGEILTQLNKDIRKSLNQESGKNRDGMDMVLGVLDKANRKVSFAGANNSLYIMQGQELEEIKGDKFPIGGLQQEEERIFTTHTINLNADTTIYLGTDGYADQFGGEQGKKFKSSSFKKLLVSIQDKSMQKQKEILNESFEIWKGNLEQVDDVCVIGVRM